MSGVVFPLGSVRDGAAIGNSAIKGVAPSSDGLYKKENDEYMSA
jgi:hypothetical protein